MPLCEPITIEEDNDVKWIREIDLNDLPIERSLDDKEYTYVIQFRKRIKMRLCTIY
jgi:hypothetical protein